MKVSSLHRLFRQSRSFWTSSGCSQQVYRIADHGADSQETRTDSLQSASSRALSIKASQARNSSECIGCAPSNVHASQLQHAADQDVYTQPECKPQLVAFIQAELFGLQHSFAFSAYGNRTDASIQKTPQHCSAGYADDLIHPTSLYQQIAPVRTLSSVLSQNIKPRLSHAHNRSLHTSVTASDTSVQQASITQRNTSIPQNATPSPAYKSFRPLPPGPANSLPLQQSASSLQAAAEKR